jgi:importin-4
VSSLWRIYARLYQVWEEGSGVKFVPGIPVKHSPPPVIIGIGEQVKKATFGLWPDDSER